MLHNKDIQELYFKLDTMRVIKSRMRWARHAVRMREKRNVYKVMVGKHE
jgi:hypothetical protein